MVVAGTEGIGRDEVYWGEFLQQLESWDGDTQAREVLLLAPHPDDDVLGCGGLLQHWCRAGKALELWMITDGEACFGEAAGDIARRRRSEAREAHRRLGVFGAAHSANALTRFSHPIRWLHLPDGQVSDYRDTLRETLRLRMTPDTLLVAPLQEDGHGDHEAIGSVARQVAQECGAELMSYPIWFWHWGQTASFASLPGNACQYTLTAAEHYRKQEAIAAYESQVGTRPGGNGGSGAILPRRVLRHFRRSFEVMLREDFHQTSVNAMKATVCSDVTSANA